MAPEFPEITIVCAGGGARIEDLLKDRFQAIDRRLLTHPVIDRGYTQWPGLTGGSSFRNLQSSHGLRLIGVLAEFLMEPFQILIQTDLEFLDGPLSAPWPAGHYPCL